jgi:deazaflavin-dependent oxidoreductase (nitroreductase family)
VAVRTYKRFINWFSATRPGGWFVRRTAAHVDPWLYRRSKGRFTMAGPLTIPQLVLTTTGAKSGQPRTIQLGCLPAGDEAQPDRWYVVASNFGQEHHPAWSYNLLAHPDATVEHDGRTAPVRATLVPDEEKDELWPRLEAVVPQFTTYRTRTDRDIRIFCLDGLEGSGDG